MATLPYPFIDIYKVPIGPQSLIPQWVKVTIVMSRLDHHDWPPVLVGKFVSFLYENLIDQKQTSLRVLWSDFIRLN